MPPRTVFKSLQQNQVDRLGLVQVDYFSSEEGVPIHKDHDYELISIYDNPTDRDSDAMAVMFIYYLDKQFEHPLTSSTGSTIRPGASWREVPGLGGRSSATSEKRPLRSVRSAQG